MRRKMVNPTTKFCFQPKCRIWQKCRIRPKMTNTKKNFESNQIFRIWLKMSNPTKQVKSYQKCRVRRIKKVVMKCSLFVMFVRSLCVPVRYFLIVLNTRLNFTLANMNYGQKRNSRRHYHMRNKLRMASEAVEVKTICYCHVIGLRYFDLVKPFYC